MKIKNLEESGIVKSAIICNDIILLMVSYWFAFALTHSFALAFSFPYALKTELLIGALTIFPTFLYSSARIPETYGLRQRHSGTFGLYRMSANPVHDSSYQSDTADERGRRRTLMGASFFFCLLYAERTIVHNILKHSRSKGHNQRYVILVGHPWNLEDIYHTLNDHSLGFKILGIFTRKELPEDMQLKNLGDRRMVMSYLRQHQEVTDLYMVPDTDYTAETDEIFRYCEDHMIRFYALPVFMEFLTKRMELSHLGSTMLLSVRNEPLQDPVNRGVKRLFDILTSGLFLLTVFPIVYLIAGIIIKIQSPGPILFKQKRNGLDGKEFYCLKFRSMHVNKDSDRIQATKNDPRKFKFGNLMRKTNIDELPQFINVFKGDMSLVGPRPHMLLHTQEYSRLIRRYMVRHLVKPGITGWAQVQGFRGETKTLDQMENRIKADIWYVENWSFGLDLRIMWRTLLNMLRHNEENAY